MINPELTGSTDNAMQEYAKDVATKSKKYATEQGVENVRSFYMGGGPARKIVKFAEDHDVSLIVLGSRGLSDSEQHLLGSDSHKVTSTSSRPVLIVWPGNSGRVDRNLFSPYIESLLYCYGNNRQEIAAMD